MWRKSSSKKMKIGPGWQFVLVMLAGLGWIGYSWYQDDETKKVWDSLRQQNVLQPVLIEPGVSDQAEKNQPAVALTGTQCLSEALKQAQVCENPLCAVGVYVTFTECLVTSQEDAAFCQGVPSLGDEQILEAWLDKRCAQLKGYPECPKLLLAQIPAFCAEQQRNKQPDS